MHLKHFGDSYDVVKQSILGWLGSFGCWAVHPMFTHNVDHLDAERFAKFLSAHLVSADCLEPLTDRGQYFANCSAFGNLMLDPTTGIRFGRVPHAKAPFYLFGPELVQLALSRPNALTLVFDQSLPRGAELKAVRSKLGTLHSFGVCAFAYVSHASFLVASGSEGLVLAAHERLLEESRLPAERFATYSAG